METPALAEAILKLAEVQDRRLGEIGSALGKIAHELTFRESRDAALPNTAAEEIICR